jgi:putative FmdB family regulatory protein
MPTYEYRCPNGHDFEKFFRTISASEASVVCPVCGKMGERQMSAGAGLVFKGSGFYLTDYGKNAHAHRGSAKPAPAKDAASTSGSSSDAAKPAESGSKPASSDAKSSTGVTSGDAKSTPKKND